MDMRFGTWNIRSLIRAGSLMTVLREISRNRLDLVGLQEVRCEAMAPHQQENTHFSMER
jgi:exonuclease III